MATFIYFNFRDTSASGNYPTTKQSGDTINRDVKSSGAGSYATPADMLPASGSSSVSNSSTAAEPGTNPHYTHMGSWISPPLPAQTLSGTFQVIAALREGSTTVNMTPRVFIYTWKASDNTKGYNLFGPSNEGREVGGTSSYPTAQVFYSATAFTSATINENDRIVIEFETADLNSVTTSVYHGIQYNNASTGSGGGALVFSSILTKTSISITNSLAYEIDDGENYSVDWTGYVTTTIAPSANVANYQHRVKVLYSTGLNADYSDIRFAQTNGAKCKYWLESSDVSAATFWVKIPSASQDTLRVYYGKVSATSRSTESTFDMFDHFASTANWMVSTTNAPAVTCMNSTVYLAKTGVTHGFFRYTAASWGGGYAVDFNITNLTEVSNWTCPGWHSFYTDNSMYNCMYTKVYGGNQFHHRCIGYDEYLTAPTYTTPGIWSFGRELSGSTVNTFRANYCAATILVYNITYTPSVDMYPGIGMYASSGTNSITLEWARVRKFVWISNSEPVVDNVTNIPAAGLGLKTKQLTYRMSNPLTRLQKTLSYVPFPSYSHRVAATVSYKVRSVYTLQKLVRYDTAVENYSGWLYAATIGITNPAATTNYQHRVEIEWNAGINSDFSDIRFTQINGTHCPYWIESKTNGVSAIVWFLVAASGQTAATMYHGRPSANDHSDMSIFNFYDHFVDPSLTKWTFSSPSCAATVSNSQLTIENTAASQICYIKSNSTYGPGYATDWKIDAILTKGYNQKTGWIPDSESEYSLVNGYNVEFINYNGTFTNTINLTLSAGTPGVHGIGRNGSNNYCYYRTGAGVYTSNTLYPPVGSIPVKVKIGSYLGMGEYITLDWVRVRKFIYPEPTVTITFDVIEDYANWTHKTFIAITSPTTEINYQHRLNVPWVSGMATNFHDIRFAQLDDTHCSYFIEPDYVTSSAATVWIKVPSASQSALVMYYGGPEACFDQSNGLNTFIFFDHFDATSLDTTKWNQISGVTYTVANSRLYIHWDGYTSSWIRGQKLGVGKTAALISATWSGGVVGFSESSGDSSTARMSYSGSLFTTYVSGDNAQCSYSKSTSPTYNVYDLAKLSAASSHLTINGSIVCTTSQYVPTVDLGVVFQPTSAGTNIIVVNWTAIRKASEIEPVAVVQEAVQFPITRSLGFSINSYIGLLVTSSSGRAPFTALCAVTSYWPMSSWTFDFGDDLTTTIDSGSTMFNPKEYIIVHQYGTNGTYLISATAASPGAYQGATTYSLTVIDDDRPIIEFYASTVTGIFPLTVRFENRTYDPGDSCTWDWDFGDGTSHSNVKNPVHVYSAPSNYSVTLVAYSPIMKLLTYSVNNKVKKIRKFLTYSIVPSTWKNKWLTYKVRGPAKLVRYLEYKVL